MIKRILTILLACLLLLGCTGRVSAPSAQTEELPQMTAEPADPPADTPEQTDATPEQGGEPTPASGDYTGPAFSLTTLTGESIDESYFREHKVTMVNFWATWCGPCVGEIPDLVKLSGDYADQGFAILGVLLWDEDLDGARAFIKEQGVTYPVVVAEGVFAELSADFYGVPSTLFFNTNGEQLLTEPAVGSRSYAGWEEEIVKLLSEVG